MADQHLLSRHLAPLTLGTSQLECEVDMGQKFAAYNEEGAIYAFYDDVDSPAPDGTKSLIEVSFDEWQACLTNMPAYRVENGKVMKVD